MTNILDALKKELGGLPSTVVDSLMEEQNVPPATMVGPAPVAAPAAPPLAAAAPSHAPVVAPDEAAAAAPARSLAAWDIRKVRTVALRIANNVPVLPFEENLSTASEQYRILRTKILQHPSQPRVIVVSSACSGDGKSITAVNLAGALSLKSDANVLLVDADLRRASLHNKLGLEQGPGLADVLRGRCAIEDAVVHTEQFRNLYVLPAGVDRGNSSELLDSSNWGAVCSKLNQVCRYIVIDSPPVAMVADYDLIQAVCDGIVMVVRPDSTNRSVCTKALQAIPKDRLLGVVVNCTPNWLLGNDYYSNYYKA